MVYGNKLEEMVDKLGVALANAKLALYGTLDEVRGIPPNAIEGIEEGISYIKEAQTSIGEDPEAV